MSRAAYAVPALCLVAFVILAGCAAPGDPSPRHPVVPTAITNLTARQAGSEVTLTFTLPSQSTDREPLQGQPTVEIFRTALNQAQTVGRKSAWRPVYTVPPERADSYLRNNLFEFKDPLTPNNLGQAGGASIGYMVRTSIARTKASEDSNYVTIQIYPPPGEPADVVATVTESAIDLGWKESRPPAGAPLNGYRVYRAELEPGQEAPPQASSQLKLKSPLEMIGPAPSTSFSDSNFSFGITYVYTVRSVAQFNATPVESADSTPVVVTPRDTFPPAVPTGLEITVMPATPEARAYVELSWAINSEADLAGYYVYRSDDEGTADERINTERLLSPTFRDISVVAGRRYFYRVSAVDRAGNESPKSSAVQTEIQ